MHKRLFIPNGHRVSVIIIIIIIIIIYDNDLNIRSVSGQNRGFDTAADSSRPAALKFWGFLAEPGAATFFDDYHPEERLQAVSEPHVRGIFVSKGVQAVFNSYFQIICGMGWRCC